MNASIISALAGLVGAAIGGLTSGLAAWFAQKTQAHLQWLVHERVVLNQIRPISEQTAVTKAASPAAFSFSRGAFSPLKKQKRRVDRKKRVPNRSGPFDWIKRYLRFHRLLRRIARPRKIGALTCVQALSADGTDRTM